MQIKSMDNRTIKMAASLQKAKYREETGCFLIEGRKVIEEAVRAKIEIINIFYSPELYNEELFNKEAIEVSKEILEKISDTVTPQGIVAVCKIPEYSIEKSERIVYLDRVQDPGNVGTIIRTADAFGFDAVVLSKGCADPYSPKVVRATMGSIFHLPIVMEKAPMVTFAHKIYASSLDAKNSIDEVKPEFPAVLVIGNEGQGVSGEIKGQADMLIKIDMKGQAESLNASVAAGILMYWMGKK